MDFIIKMSDFRNSPGQMPFFTADAEGVGSGRKGAQIQLSIDYCGRVEVFLDH